MLVLAVVIVWGAAVVRLTALDQQPGGLYPDEAAEAYDAHLIIHNTGFHPVFFDDDGGREALFAYLVSLGFRVVGEHVWSLRVVAALVGTAAVAVTGLALRRFGGGAALAGMAWSAGSLWLVCISRDGMRNILVPLAGAAALGLLLRWGDRPGRGRAVAAGAAVGAGLWTYQPLKLLPLLVAVWVFWIRRYDRDRFHRIRAQGVWFGAAYLVIAFPMLVTAVVDPGGYFGRGAAVSAFAPDQRGVSLLLHTLRTLGMFFVAGDPNPRHNVGTLPLLGLPLTVLAMVGAWHAWRRRRDPRFSLVLIGVPVFLIPPLIGVEGGSPHFLRSLGLAPFLAALIGIGTMDLIRRTARLGKPAETATAIVVAMALVALGVGSAQAYFSRTVADRYDAYSFALVALADIGYGGPGNVVIVDGYGAVDVRFLDYLAPPTIVSPGVAIAHPAVYSRIAASSRELIDQAAGPEIAAHATVVARDPAGHPRVWAVSP